MTALINMRYHGKLQSVHSRQALASLASLWYVSSYFGLRYIYDVITAIKWMRFGTTFLLFALLSSSTELRILAFKFLAMKS
jgi:hypothetical protein